MIQAVTQWDHSDGDVFPVFSHNIFEYREECSLLQAIIKAQDEGPHPTCLPVATVGVSSISWTVGLGDKIDMSD